MTIDRMEYVLLRLIRRWLVPARMPGWLARALPYVRTGEAIVDPQGIAARWANAAPGGVAGKRVLEIGAGPTNATARALLAAGAAEVAVFEPFAPLTEAPSPEITRVAALSEFSGRRFDLIVSHSVLEHVADPPALFADLAPLLAPGGAMVHVVDYRDHFFKYPYHFLMFSRATWDRWLNPGDLPRWRLRDHLYALEQTGWAVQVPDRTRDAQAFARVAGRLDAAFDPTDPDMDVTGAVLLCTR